SLFGDVRRSGRDVEQRAGGPPGPAAGDVPADDFLSLDSRTHERSQLDLRADALARAVHDPDRDASPVDGRKYADVGIGDVVGDPGDRDCGSDMGRRTDLSGRNPDVR